MNNLKKLPDYGYLLPLDEWKDEVRCGTFLPSDGTGNFATEISMTTTFDEDNIFDLESIPEWVTHIMWFNK